MPAQAQRMSSLLAADMEPEEKNIRNMSVTLDVSKLSGWLNAYAFCESKGGHVMRGEGYGPGGVRAFGGGSAIGVHGGGPTQGLGGTSSRK